MITGVEIDMVVSDSRRALEVYEGIFAKLERLEVTDLGVGGNEAVFTLYGSRFHMLDENPEYQMVAPRPGDPKPLWLNVAVEDIAGTWERALAAGCAEVQPPTDMMGNSVTNAMFTCPFGYMWMLHQIHRELSLEEREQMFKDEMGQ